MEGTQGIGKGQVKKPSIHIQFIKLLASICVGASISFSVWKTKGVILITIK